MMTIIRVIEELEVLKAFEQTRNAKEALGEAIGIIEKWAVEHPDEK